MGHPGVRGEREKEQPQILRCAQDDSAFFDTRFIFGSITARLEAKG